MPDEANFEALNTLLWRCLQWEPSYEQLEQMILLQQLLREWNSIVNLTRLVEGSDYWISQIIDSLWPLKYELQTPNKSRQIIDIGTGCGFPGIAIAIALPGTKVTLVDSIRKKTTALIEITKKLGLTDRISIRTERVELTGQDQICRGQFDLAMARAVTTAPIAAEYLVPLLSPNGEALLYRGQWSQADKKSLKNALIHLKAIISKIESYELPENRGRRHQVRIKGISACPDKFPRAIGIPAKRPLGI